MSIFEYIDLKAVVDAIGDRCISYLASIETQSA